MEKKTVIKQFISVILIVVFAVVNILLFTSQKPVHYKTSNDSLTVTGKASFYANMLNGQNTSSGDLYNKNDFTCAHRTLPFNTLLRVTNVATGKSVIVRVNDRGPYKKGRLIDLSNAAAKKLGMTKKGIVKVKIRELPSASTIPLTDSLLHNGDVLDTYGNPKHLNKNAIKVWNTQDLSHAVYMATDIENEYAVDCVYIKVSEKGNNKKYALYIPGMTQKEETDKLIASLKQDGFSLCRVEKK